MDSKHPYIDKKDLNTRSTLVPIRRGCFSNEACACSGRCQEIIGHINHSYYNREVAKGVDTEELLLKELQKYNG